MIVDRTDLEQLRNALHSACNALEHIQTQTTTGGIDLDWPSTFRTVREAIALAQQLCDLA